MSRFEELLGTDFEGRPTTDLEAVIYDAFDDPRHRERVPGLVSLLNDAGAPDRERFLACVALATWGEAEGYKGVIDAARDPKNTPWYGILIDRKFSLDNTFAQLSLAVADSTELAQEKGTGEERREAFRSLVRLADREYFDEKLGDQLDPGTVAVVLPDIREVVARGAKRLASGKQQFDLSTQLIDLAAAVAPIDAATSVGLAHDVLAQNSHHRALVHAVAIVNRSNAPECRRFGEYLLTVGDDQVRTGVSKALGAS